MIDQAKLDRLMALPADRTTSTYKCELVQNDMLIEVLNKLSFNEMRMWLVKHARRTGNLVKVTNESTGEIL